MKFGLKLVRLRKKLIAQSVTFPEPGPDEDGSRHVGERRALLLFQDCAWDDMLTDAELPNVMQYLRGSYFLQLPMCWKKALAP